MIDVKDKNSKVRCSVEITDKCVYSKTLMEEEYVLLSFDSDTLIDFAKGDYIITDDFGKFIIVDVTKPTSNGKGGWTYEQKFHADWERFRNRICFYDRQRGSEKSWKMTQKPEYFLDIVCENIRNAGYGRYSFEVDASLTEMKLVEFDGTNIIDALTNIAEAWETEWWISDSIIHLGKCEYGSAVSLSENDEIADIDREDGQDTDYYTRAYVFGSTRNLPTNYRHNDDGNTVVEGVVETRLKLPSGTSYVDAWDNLKDEDIVEAVVVFDDIYPRKTGTISTITTKQYTDTTENEDGTTTKETWNAYRFTDAELAALKFSKDYVLAGEELRIVFQTGKLAGMDFAVTFNPDAKNESDAAAQVFEIVRNDDYGVNLPADDFKPSVGDTYILYGYDTSFCYTKLVPEAEQELLAAAKEKIAEACKDKSVYNCTTNVIRCAGYKPNSTGQLVYREADTIDLDVGQSVILRSDNYFGSTGYRQSRVQSFEKRLDNKYNATYVIGESNGYSKSEELNEQVEALTVSQKTLSNNYGSQVHVVRRYDTTAPSDNNVPSFKRAQYEFMQKHVADRATAKQVFEQGVELGDFTAGEQGGMIDGKGNAELLTLIVRQMLSSARYVHGFTGEGWQLWIDDNGLSNLEIDKLTVRQIMTVFEMLIERIRAVGGQIIVSAANGKIKSVTETTDGYQIYFEDNNYFAEHDLMRCQVFKGYTYTDADGKEQTRGVKSYWVEVLAAYADSVVVAKSEFEAYGTIPEAGDEVVLCGNTTNELRQNLISISATEDGQPRIDVLDGVTEKNFNNSLRARLGNLDGITDDWFPTDNQPHGNGLYADNAYLRGTFLLSTGEDIKTKFEIVEGKIESAVSAVRSDFMEDKGFLNNPTFADGLTHWTATNDTVFFLFGQRWIWGNSNVLSKKGDGASIYTDDTRKVVRIKNSSIIQKYADFRAVPEIKTNADGKKEAAAVYLSFFYKVITAGTLTVGFENINNDGFADYEPMSASVELEPTDTYQQYTISGLWNSTGDFKVAYTGEIYVYMLVLSTDRIETLTNTYKTLFEQSERLVKISAAVFDKDENALKETGLFVKPDGAGIYAQDANGNVALIGVSTEVTDSEGNTKSVIMLTADNIKLEGLTTINENFKILEDGSIEATNGTFNGKMKGVTGSFYHLYCINNAGEEIGGITFNSDGQMTFEGDLYSQGYDSKKERGYRFYTSDIFCRGMLGHSESTMAVVKDTKMYVYTKGASKDPVEVDLGTGTTSDNRTFYKVSLYGGNGDWAGMPIDVVVFNCTQSYYYQFTGLDNGKRWMVVNGNDDGSNVYFCDIGGWHTLGGGHTVNCVYVNPDFLSPVPDTAGIGRGVFWSGSNDLNW